MSQMSFFDVSVAQGSNQIPSGDMIDINCLIRSKLSLQADLFKGLGLLSSIEHFDPYGIEKPMYWEKVMMTIIHCLSGQIPDRQEVLRGRQIICQLPKFFKKKYLDEQFVVSFLPYVLIGFKTHVEGRFQADSNRIDELCNFIVHLYETDHAEVTSYLCAHRGFAPSGQHVLIDALKLGMARRTLNLQKAILANVRQLKSRKIRWCQQGPTAMASSNMFPEMFIQYLMAGKVPDLLVLLGKHFNELNSLSLGEHSGLVDFKVANLDVFTVSTHAFLDSQFGVDWRITDFESGGAQKTPLVRIALDQVMPEIRRLIPFYGSSLAENFLETRQECLKRNLARAQEIEADGLAKNIVIRTLKAIDWFYYNQLMHITAKALYEAAFFYVWGQTTASQRNRIAVGIDRDHAGYQSSAWSLGYTENRDGLGNPPTSIIYARRNQNEIPGSALRDISFRQFWR